MKKVEMSRSPTPSPTPTPPSTPGKTGPSIRGGGGRARLAGQALTNSIIRGLKPGDEVADPAHPGLRIRQSKTGSPVAFYRYRDASGALRQVEIGAIGAKTLTTIRAEWQALKDAVRNGKDPRADAAAAKRAQVEKKRAEKLEAYSLRDMIEDYLAEMVDSNRKAKGAAESRRMLLRSIASNANEPAASLTIREAHEMVLTLAKTAPRVAAMTRQELRAAWAHALAAGRISVPSPFAGKSLGGKFKVRKRERVLEDGEVSTLLRWMAEPGTYSRTVRDALEVALRTGLRSGEVCGIHARELVRRDGVLWLDIPPERMKAGKPHSVPLLGKAAEIVSMRMSDGFLFPSTRPESSIAQKVLGVEVYACSGRSQAKAYAHRRVCPVANWAPHDLRRTARTMLAELGCPFEVGEAILAHELPGVAGHYLRSKFESEKIDWLGRLGRRLDDLVSSHAPLQVVA